MPGSVTLKGHVVLRLNGEVIADASNTIVTDAYSAMAEVMAGNLSIGHFEMGTDNSATTVGMQALQGTLLDYQDTVTAVVATAQVTFSGTLGSGLTGAVTVGEFGLFTGNYGGDTLMIARFLPASFSMTTGDIVTVEWTIAFSEE